MTETEVVLKVGKDSEISKMLMYVLGTLADKKNTEQLRILSRGKAISKAVDVQQILEGKGIAKLKDIKLGTDIDKKTGRKTSTAEIVMVKTNNEK